MISRLSVAERLEHLGNPAAEHFLSGADGRIFRSRVGQQITEVAVFAVAHRTVEADRITAHRQHAARLVDGRARLASGLFDRRLAAQLLEQLPRHVAHAHDMVSTMCTGMRMVRLWSATARVMAWRIHQVAYVQNLKPRRYSNLSTARIKPALPS